MPKADPSEKFTVNLLVKNINQVFLIKFLIIGEFNIFTNVCQGIPADAGTTDSSESKT